MFHKNILSGILILINKFKRSFAIFKLILNNCFIGVKHCTNYVVITELIICVDGDETEIKRRIVGEVLGGRSYTSVQIDNDSDARDFKYIVIGHGKRFDGLV